MSDSSHVCLFCGHGGRPIQAGLTYYRDRFETAPSSAYGVTGHFCDCVHAAKYLAVQAEIEEEERRHEAALDALHDRLPAVNEDIAALAAMSREQRHVVERLMGKEK